MLCGDVVWIYDGLPRLKVIAGKVDHEGKCSNKEEDRTHDDCKQGEESVEVSYVGQRKVLSRID